MNLTLRNVHNKGDSTLPSVIFVICQHEDFKHEACSDIISDLYLFFHKAWGEPNTFTAEELQKLNNFAKGFTADKLYTMDFSSSDVIESFGSVSGFSMEQAQKIFEKIKESNSVPSMTGTDLLRLGSIALGMSTTDISNINTDEFK